jgi:ATP-dependent DNA helicase RecQ
MSIYKEILQKYWGYPDFRPLQEDIIRSVADDNRDTLGLLPTGGGKSIIFQVPALAMPGLCIVVSPLIALMKDQVENLQKHNIPAAAIYTGMSKNEIELIFEKAAGGQIKFLYLSPERLGTMSFLVNLPEMKINLLAVDEAHCISQWGYDFRPSYLKIAEVRNYIPDVPVLALTATATPEVVDDIQEKLLFKQKNVFRKSFERKNLIYIVRKTTDKYGQLLNLIKSIQGSGVVYVRSRKLTEKVANFLQIHSISADYYHAGLQPKEKDKKQELWKQGNIRVIVATNAFGMGIDKSDVRFVIHIDLPDSLEAYFQEAGRGGRDLKDAYAFLLYNDEDVINLRNNLEKSFPPKQSIYSVYEALCNYLKIPIGGGKGQSFPFVLSKFVENYNFKPLLVYNSLKFLQNEELIEYTEEIRMKSKLHIRIDKEELYKFRVEKPKYDSFLKFLLRNYAGLFSEYVTIDEYWMAKVAKVNPKLIFDFLIALHKMQVVDYQQQRSTPYITFIEERLSQKSLRIKEENYDLLKKNYEKKIEAVINYAEEREKCRSQILLEYFGEYDAPRCGRCDVCYFHKKRFSDKELRNKIIETLKNQNLTIKELVSIFAKEEKEVLEMLKVLIDNGVVVLDDSRKLKYKA